MARNGVAGRRASAPIDHDIATGVWPDMTEHGWDARRLAGDLRAGDGRRHPRARRRRSGSATSPRSCKQVIERLYGNSHLLNDAGQYAYYGRVGGCLITGNEDGVKHCAMNVLYSLQHLGYTIPPQADAGWIGEAGPGPVATSTRAPAARRTTSPTATPRS